ncbi:MAG: hypothetical protein MJ123_00275 [Lachnospiraceae bacterium]|nr:hypothetical protein [Lachnospiraceae bacterium]
MNERFDAKLILLRMIRGWYRIVIGIILGALIIGIPYVFINVILADDKDYQMHFTVHVDYEEDSSGTLYDIINEVTWGTWVDTDIFIDAVSNKLGGDISPEQLRAVTNATLETDVRLVEFYVVTKDPQITEMIANACMECFTVLDEHIRELNVTEIVYADKYATEVQKDIRIKNAVLLGAVLGLLVTVFLMLILYLLDDSVYIPLLFTERFSVPIKTEKEIEADKSFIKDATLVHVGKDFEGFPEKYTNNSAILEIESGAHNGKLLLAMIYELEEQGINIKGAVLKNADYKLIKAYMASTKFPNPFMKE